MNYSILSKINYPSDLRALKQDELILLCHELRQFLIDDLSHNPGHFASSLGVVELTVALHYVFNTPLDKLVWDVGHQAYSHKILTGRKDQFHTKRRLNGLSGFPSISESPYDAFTVGHASTSISAALGMAVASRLDEDKDRSFVAIIGDGSMTGGLAFEGLNNACINPNNLLIILNDNDMAIDNNVGGISKYLVGLTTSKTYNKFRGKLYRFLCRQNILKEGKKGAITRLNNSLKSFLTQQNNFFEGLNIRYFGPVNGNDVIGLVRVLEDLKQMDGPKILHIKTTKGKGYTPAEQEATIWHAPGKFDKETGQRIANVSELQPPLYQDVFGHTLVELAKQNDAIVGITPAMPTGCSMTYMMKEFPSRAFDVGIAEGHAVTFSGGLAAQGKLPFCNIYSSFMQRAYDNVIHDIALQNLNVVFCLDRAGVVGEDGPTHHGAFDLAAFRPIPNLIISAPINEHVLRNLMYTAQQKDMGPFMIRYPRGRGVKVDWESPMTALQVGKGQLIKEGSDLLIISLGHIGNAALEAANKAEESGISVAVADMIFLKPIDEDLLHYAGKSFKKIITVEDGVIAGGLGTAVIEFFSEYGYTPKVKRLGIPNSFITHGTIPELQSICGYDEQGILNTIKEFMA
ncbi:MAG: 1-deoxy-D-xylulose-5-phosphate synthase [Bacteroidales bacterium]